jgi:carbon storage regulator CsrA
MMLVLTRFKNDDIVLTIGAERVVIRIVDVFGGKVRVGIDANEAVTINRGEVQIEIDRAEERRQELASR